MSTFVLKRMLFNFKKVEYTIFKRIFHFIIILKYEIVHEPTCRLKVNLETIKTSKALVKKLKEEILTWK